MQPSAVTKYTNFSQDDFNRFKTAAKVRGINIGGNKEDALFDLIPVHVEYNPEAKTLELTVSEPHWLAPNVTLGVLHQMVAASTNVQPVPRSNENPVITHDHTVKVEPAANVPIVPVPAKSQPQGATLQK